MEGPLKQHKAETTQRWSRGSGSRSGPGSDPMHSSLALAVMALADSPMLITLSGLLTWFSSNLALTLSPLLLIQPSSVFWLHTRIT